MIARLRRKFVVLTMVAVTLVLAALMGVVNIANYVNMDERAGGMLSLLAENEGKFPDFKPPGDVTPPEPDDQAAGGRPFAYSAEAPYETRFFTVRLRADGGLSEVNTGKIAAVSSSEAAGMARTLLAAGRTDGYLGSYKFLTRASGGDTLYVFLDCTRDLEAVRTFFVNSLLVSAFGAVCVFLLALLLSKRAIKPLAESYQKQKEFITNAGHEIKTPLAIIDSCAEVLELENGGNKWLDGIRGQVRRLAALTQSLVSLARMDEGSASLPMEPFDLSAAADETLAPFELLVGSRGLKMTLDIRPGIRCNGNERTLRELCSILADNAVKYASPGGEIVFRLSRAGRRTVLSCENPAEGLAAGDRRELFDRFYRGDASRGSETGGCGVGLSLAQSIVQAHGGRIEARSDDGTTLRVTATLP